MDRQLAPSDGAAPAPFERLARVVYPATIFTCNSIKTNMFDSLVTRSLTLWLLWVFFVTESVGNRLKLAHVLFRHGDRSPTALFPNDNNTEGTWGQGLGQLTLFGKKQEFWLGQYMRKRYMFGEQLLNTSYDRHQVMMQSTDFDRTLMSAQCVMAALYPPQEGQLFDETILWQPLPIHTTPKSRDYLLNMEVECHRYDEILNHEALASTEYRKYVEDSTEFTANVCEKAGYNQSDIQNVYTVYDAIVCEIWNNRYIPSWVTSSVVDQLSYMKGRQIYFWFFNLEMMKIKIGPMLKKITERLKSVASGEAGDDQGKLFLYSAHDTTVAALLHALGLWDRTVPGYGSAVYVELYEDKRQQYAVQISYSNATSNDTFSEPVVLRLKDCKELCPLSQFLQIIEPVVFEGDWFEYCTHSPYDGVQISKGGVIAATILVAMALVALLVLVIWCHRHSRGDIHYQTATFSSARER